MSGTPLGIPSGYCWEHLRDSWAVGNALMQYARHYKTCVYTFKFAKHAYMYMQNIYKTSATEATLSIRLEAVKFLLRSYDKIAIFRSITF